MTNLIKIALIFHLLIVGSVLNAQEKEALHWSELPPLPDKEGFAGMYAGVSNGALIAAGGANFPEKRPWEGGTKAWYKEIYVLENPDGQWIRAAATLPRPMAYGVSITYKNALICIGGTDAETLFAEVLKLEWNDGAIKITSLPSLPQPMAYLAGALVGDMVYVAGGLSSPQANGALHKFLAMDLSAANETMHWVECEPWPGPERALPVAASQGGAFFLVSGYRLAEEETADGRLQTARVFPYLVDGYRYTPGRHEDKFSGTWQRIADIPQAVVGAPNPALSLGLEHFAILGGIDTETAKHTDLENYPEFPHDIVAYHIPSDTWLTLGQMPQGSARIAAPTTFWAGRWIVPSGEARPGIRSPKVNAINTEAKFGWVNWMVLILYLVLMLGMGFYFTKRYTNTNEFFLAGRRIPWWAAGISIFATQMSAVTYLALPAIVYQTNWALMIGSLTGIAVMPIVTSCYVPFYRRLNVTTAYEFLELRFNLAVRWLGSLTFIFLQFGRMGIVLFLPALAIAAVTDIDIFLCIAMMGLVCTIYTVMGGMEAVIWTAVVQTIISLGGAILCLVLIFSDVAGGLAGIIDIGMQDQKFALYNPGYSYKEFVLWVAIVGFFPQFIPYTSDQAVVQRYLTTKDEAGARKRFGYISP
jgi:N-acetylneuraminic acid mutarotase